LAGAQPDFDRPAPGLETGPGRKHLQASALIVTAMLTLDANAATAGDSPGQPARNRRPLLPDAGAAA